MPTTANRLEQSRLTLFHLVVATVARKNFYIYDLFTELIDNFYNSILPENLPLCAGCIDY